jgi:ribonuclease HI
MSNKIRIHTDGGCRSSENNLGAWAAILEYKYHYKEISGIEIDTTNNRMELMACIKALQIILMKDVPICITTDSQYVQLGMTQWINGWIINDWCNSKGDRIENVDLWEVLYGLSKSFENEVEFIKCRGHYTDIMNINVDKLVNATMDKYLSKQNV